MSEQTKRDLADAVREAWSSSYTTDKEKNIKAFCVAALALSKLKRQENE